MGYEELVRATRAFHGRVIADMWRRAPDVGIDLWAASFRGDSLFFRWAKDGRLCEASHHTVDHKDYAPDDFAIRWLEGLKGGKILRRDRGTVPPWDDESSEERRAQAELLADLLASGLKSHSGVEITRVGVSREYRPTALVLRWSHGGAHYQWAHSPLWSKIDAQDVLLELEEGVWQAVPVSQL